MTIEFNCPQCGKLLRTSDDKSGRDATCPGCGTSITVPTADRSAHESIDWLDDQPNDSIANQPLSAAPAGTKRCPVCGEEIKAAATRCRYCGEDLGGGPLPAAGGNFLKPHRGNLLLGISIGSWVGVFGCACCLVFGIAGIAAAVVTIVLANQDLKEMLAGTMDPTGNGMTRAAKIIAIVQLCFSGLAVLAYAAFLIFAIAGNNMQGGFRF